MPTSQPRAPVQPGEPAPDFTLPAVDRAGTVSLADYRGRSPLFLAILRGLWCSFCRRHIVQLGGTRERLEKLGIQTLAVIASDTDRARLYIRQRPARVPLAADPDMVTHRAYGLPTSPWTPEIAQAWRAMRASLKDLAVSPDDLAELQAAARAADANPKLEGAGTLAMPDFVGLTRGLYPYQMTPDEQAHRTRNEALATGQFVVDRDGLIRWAKIQSPKDLPTGLANYPTEADVLAAVQRALG